MQLSAHTNRTGRSVRKQAPLFSLIEPELRKVKKLVNKQLADTEEPLSRLVKRMRTTGGKMLRPGLVLLSAAATGKITQQHIRIAAIMETIHSATLLHDDVVDEGEKRRGLPTINSLWGNESAVLVGDFLLSRVFAMCSDLRPDLISMIAALAERLCRGELKQVVERQNRQLIEREYMEIITDKTAAFFATCCELGGILAGAKQEQVRLLGRFGLNVGIAFQITDDLLDIIGDEDKTGKTLGTDASTNKITLPVIHLLRKVNENERKAVVDWLNRPAENKGRLIEMLKRSGSLEYAQGRAEQFASKAIASLDSLDDSGAKDALIQTARYVAASGRVNTCRPEVSGSVLSSERNKKAAVLQVDGADK